MVEHIVNLDFNYPVVVFVFIFLLCLLAMLSLYLLWKTFVFALKCFVDSRLVEINKQKDRLWLAVEDLYESTDDLKERTWDYDNNRKQVRKLTKELYELEEYVLNQKDWDGDIKRLWEQRDAIYHFIEKLENKH